MARRKNKTKRTDGRRHERLHLPVAPIAPFFPLLLLCWWWYWGEGRRVAEAEGGHGGAELLGDLIWTSKEKCGIGWEGIGQRERDETESGWIDASAGIIFTIPSHSHISQTDRRPGPSHGFAPAR